jgi:2TM domain-containing protein
MNPNQLQEVARKRVQMKRGFAVHLTLYVTVNSLLFAIWYLTGKGYPWFLWPLAGWGVGIVANTIAVAMELLFPEEAAVDREMKRLSH